ncbi:dTDP-4-dehydrorhamnose reductase [Pseudomonas nitroreducens]|uniref:dTDP-4-dehydrorhamnose reductase n=1 Tax=Pseudomonas nitroreducens TaxID=46680 RepID=UPI002D7ECA98|nr:dTDP-4-dehydrorhamnose reductase [Pseudomonas nitroreducens]
MNRILLLGANGQLGWELQRALSPLGSLIACDRRQADMEDLIGLKSLVQEIRPSLIVNAAAYTAVDKAEAERDRAFRVNAEATGLLAKQAMQLNARLVHYSTDYVFDGAAKQSYCEDDQANPLNVYGHSKLAGEQAIRASGCPYLIFRTSWVYAHRGANFAKTILRLARERDELRVVADQIGAPTSAELIADISAQTLYALSYRDDGERHSGVYHLTAEGETSWYEYARFVVEESRRIGIPLRTKPEGVLPIRAKDYPLPAPRPLNSRLNTDKLRSVFGFNLPHWEFHMRRMLVELAGGNQA